MKYSRIFPKTLKQSPADAQSANAKLLEQAGFIRKHMAGVYNFMPLGLRVLTKINQIIRDEMDSIGGQELQMTAMQPKELWEKTKRWQSLKEVMYQFADTGLAITHEEVFTDIASKSISSYKDLPLYLYQIQTKFRNEARPRFGLVRGREFLMKDLYSFDLTNEAHQDSYKKIWDAYLKAFKRVGLEVKVVEASGGVFSKEYSHEFQVLIDSGEDEVIYCDKCDFAQNREICDLKQNDKCPRCGSAVKISNAIEVGNIFHLGTRFSETLGLFVTDEKGSNQPVIMGSYGWGPSRIMGTIVEVSNDDRGIIWPESVAPYQVHLVGLDLNDSATKAEAEKVYKLLQVEGIEVLFDDREDISAGAKFADSDLIGIPYRVVVSKRNAGKLEIKKRFEKETQFKTLEQFLDLLKN
jgi:prolyl-tRNA synthetase